MTLTEQWKKGELLSGFYYTRRCLSKRVYIEYLGQAFFEDNVEVIALVPSYKEWQELKDEVEIYHNNFKLMKAELEREIENQQLKEMLYKCREKLDWLNGGYDVWGGELTGFIEEIDNAIGEK